MPKVKFIDQGNLVCVTWHDAFSSNSWRSKDQLIAAHSTKCEVRQIGEVFRHDKKGITLVNGLDGGENFSGYFHIPAAYIQKIEKISKRKYWSVR